MATIGSRPLGHGMSRSDLALKSGLLVALLLSRSASCAGSEDLRKLPAHATVSHEPAAVVPQAMRWEPPWRKKADCGPISLYVFARLIGLEVAFDRIERQIQVDPVRGCTLDQLCRAADEMGLSAEARFVQPDDLTTVPFPCILHGIDGLGAGAGHFLVLTGYSGSRRQFAAINPSTELFGWVPEASVRQLYTGYVLVPTSTAERFWRRCAGLLLVFACAVALGIQLWRDPVVFGRWAPRAARQ